MHTPFSLDQHPRRAAHPLSEPPAGYFERLPTQVMARVAAPVRQPGPLAWLLRAPAYLRTGLASTLLLGTFAASLWLGNYAPASPAASALLDAVPREQLVNYLLSGDTHIDMLDLAELPQQPQHLTRQYLRPSAGELDDALDAQPAADDPSLL